MFVRREHKYIIVGHSPAFSFQRVPVVRPAAVCSGKGSGRVCFVREEVDHFSDPFMILISSSVSPYKPYISLSLAASVASTCRESTWTNAQRVFNFLVWYQIGTPPHPHRWNYHHRQAVLCCGGSFAN